MIPSSSFRRHAPALALVLAAAGLASADPGTVGMTVPPFVAGATLVGHVPASTVLTMSISLAPADRAAFRAYADAVSDPNSAAYRQFLTPVEIGTRFGQATGTVNSMVAYLKGKGLTVTQVGDTHLAILFKGTVGAVESAFATKINNYRLANRDTPGPTEFYSYATVPKLPTSLAPKVVSIGGLQNAYPRTPTTTLMYPSQSRGLYGAAGLYAARKGEGITVGITNYGDGYRLSNLPVFFAGAGLPTPPGGIGANVFPTPVAGISGTNEPEGIETNLDIQMILGGAPFAKVLVYDGYNADLVSIAAREVQDNAADIISESWVFYDAPEVMEATNDQHVAMTVEGITYLAATGDWGADDSRGNYSHSYPDVVAIGGTDATVSDANGTRKTEFGWYYSGAGWEPYPYSFNTLPKYQKNVPTVPQNLNKRLYPDFSLHAAASWMVAGGNGIAVGGTSSSTPQCAGLLALVLQRMKEVGAADGYPLPNGTHYRLGRIQDVLYALPDKSSAFYDVTQGAAEFLLHDGTTPESGIGWDFVTGWGAPNSEGVYAALVSATGIPFAAAPLTADIHTIVNPTLRQGKRMSGDVGSLATSDGTAYVVQSVTQAGVGQVAAIDATVVLDSRKPKSASVQATLTVPTTAVGYVYLYNYAKTDPDPSKNFDLVATVTGNGKATNVKAPFDVTATSPYVQGGSVRMLVRAMRPARFGNSPFTLNVDQAVVAERVLPN